MGVSGSPTYLRGTTYSSCPDLTLVSCCLSSKVRWFTDMETHGNHLCLSCSKDGIVRGRVNFRRNVVVADVAPATFLTNLFTITDISSIPVRAKKASINTCSGVVYNMDSSIGTEHIMASVTSQLPIIECSRTGCRIIVTFSGPKLHADIELYKQRRSVRSLRPLPTQCTRSARYGHVEVTCTSTRRTVRCEGLHHQAECAAEQPKCLFCEAKHLGTEPRCPR
ncbi:hypothetical protein HPB51_023177 [Rhipicephalus microplus]|uniref:Tick transposon n=1 Tax=Rhipicephalus microplus TaxID=6941 RepID=A0A9J6DDG9_RHIMP|nr:hypothetical protein HPB51_023177 [Rhipicephalus microplus]